MQDKRDIVFGGSWCCFGRRKEREIEKNVVLLYGW